MNLRYNPIICNIYIYIYKSGTFLVQKSCRLVKIKNYYTTRYFNTFAIIASM